MSANTSADDQTSARELPCGKTRAERGLAAMCTEGQTSFLGGFDRWTNRDERRNYSERRGDY